MTRQIDEIECPRCGAHQVVPLHMADWQKFDYYECTACGRIWRVQKAPTPPTKP